MSDVIAAMESQSENSRQRSHHISNGPSARILNSETGSRRVTSSLIQNEPPLYSNRLLPEAVLGPADSLPMHQGLPSLLEESPSAAIVGSISSPNPVSAANTSSSDIYFAGGGATRPAGGTVVAGGGSGDVVSINQYNPSINAESQLSSGIPIPY